MVLRISKSVINLAAFGYPIVEHINVNNYDIKFEKNILVYFNFNIDDYIWVFYSLKIFTNSKHRLVNKKSSQVYLMT